VFITLDVRVVGYVTHYLLQDAKV